MPPSATNLPLSSSSTHLPTSPSPATSRPPWYTVGGERAHMGLCPSLAVAATAAGATSSAPLDALGRAANWAEELSSLSTSLVNVIAAIGIFSLASHVYARWKEREERLKEKRRGICRALEAWLDADLQRREVEATMALDSASEDVALDENFPELAGCLKAVLSHDKQAAKIHRVIFGRAGGGRTQARVALLLLWHQIAIADPDAPVELHARLVDEALVRSERGGSITHPTARLDSKSRPGTSASKTTQDTRMHRSWLRRMSRLSPISCVDLYPKWLSSGFGPLRNESPVSSGP